MKYTFIVYLAILSCVKCKINPKALTESMGQEVIEIGAPLKELPPDLEEEPAAENDELVTSTTVQAATKIKPAGGFLSDKSKESNKIDRVKQEDEEARIEKELAEMYKDTDYKADSAEVSTKKEDSTNSSTPEAAQLEDKEIGRSRNRFKFQPEENNPNAIARFRTSIDEISCDKNKLAGSTSKPYSSFATRLVLELSMSVAFLFIFLIC